MLNLLTYFVVLYLRLFGCGLTEVFIVAVILRFGPTACRWIGHVLHEIRLDALALNESCFPKEDQP